jgi:hypothetical protein
MRGNSSVVRKIEAISSSPEADCHHIETSSLPAIAQWARDHDFNCVVVGDDSSHIALTTIAAVSCGRTDLAHPLSTDDLVNYAVPILRPVRQCLALETAFYCRQHSLTFSEEPTLFERAFSHEKALLEAVLADGHGATPFAVQSLAEKLSGTTAGEKCPECGLPTVGGRVCEICTAMAAFR